MKASGFAICVGFVAWAVLHHATQGMHEDTTYVAAFSGNRPIFWEARGLSAWSLWMQIHHGVTPFAVRAWNLIGALSMVGLVGLFAVRLGLSGWLASVVILLHPLAIETLMTMSGRYELIASIGILTACLGTTMRNPLVGSSLIVGGLGLGWLGKQSAIVGVPLVALVWWIQHDTAWARGIFVAALLAMLVVLWQSRYAGTLDLGNITYRSPIGTWALLQTSAAWRLIMLAALPINQTPDYDYDGVQFWWRIMAAIGLIGGVLWTALLWHQARLVAMSFAWIGLVCLPRLIVQTPKSYFNEHQFYLALVGVALGWAAVYQLAERRCCAIA